MDLLDPGKMLGGMQVYVKHVLGAASAAFGLWAFLLVVNAIIPEAWGSINPNVAGLALGTDFWPTLGLFVGISILIGVARDAWENHRA